MGKVNSQIEIIFLTPEILFSLPVVLRCLRSEFLLWDDDLFATGGLTTKSAFILFIIFYSVKKL